MIRKILSLTLVAVLVVFVGTACKKKANEAETKSYLADPNTSTPLSGTVAPKPVTEPCLQKGAMGVQGLLLKSDCADVDTTNTKCGNGNKDAGEDCDDGAKNGLEGSLCDIKCKNVTGGTNSDVKPEPKPGDSTVTVKITNTKKMADGKLGVEYSATLTASGAKSAKYKWSTEDIPDGFTATPNKGKLTIKGKTDVANVEPYTPTIKVCEEGSDVNCVTCLETICSFSIKDQYRIEAHSFPYKGKDDVAMCSSDKTTPCNYELKAGGSIFTAWNNKGEIDPYYVLRLQVKDGVTLKDVFSVGSAYNDPDVGYAKTYDDLYYKWSMTVDGNSKPTPFVKWMDYGSKHTLDAVASEGLFLMDTTDDKIHLVYPGIAYIMVGPKAMGKEFKNVVVTVTSKNFGTQVIKFDSIKTPTVTGIETAVQEIKQKNCADAPPLKIDGVTMADETAGALDTATPVANQSVFVFSGATVQMNQDYKLTIKISGGLGKYTISPVSSDVIAGAGGHDPKHISYYIVAKGSDGKIKYHKDNTGMPVPDYEGKSGWHTVNETITTGGKSWEIVGDTYYLNAVGDADGQITETFNVDIGDSECADHKRTAVIKIKTALSKPEYVTDLKMVYINVKTEWTDSGSSKLNIQLMSGSNVFAETGDFSAQLGSNDPSSITGHLSLKNYGCVAGTDSCKIDKITAIRIHANDPSSVCGWSFWQCVTYDMTYDFTELRLVSDHFVAKSTTQVSGQCAGTCNNDTYTLKSFVGAAVDGSSVDTTGIWHKK